MGGEIVINVDHLVHTDDFVKPITGKNYGHDLGMITKEGEHLYICGKNNWGYLALEILKPINKEYRKLYQEFINRYEDRTKKNPKAILLGDAEWRIIDIVERIQEGNKDPYMFFDIPLLHNNGVETGITYLVEETAPGRANENLNF